MQEGNIEERLLKNEFLMRLRTELVPDNDMFDELCSLLRELAVYWKGEHLIRKDVAEHLYGLASTTRDIAERFREKDPDFYSRVLRCLLNLMLSYLKLFIVKIHKA